MDAASLIHLADALGASSIELSNFGVWPGNWPTVEAFLAVGTQWRTTPIGGGFAPLSVLWVGLDYTAVRTSLDAEGINVTPELWRGLRAMEYAACAVLNESRN